MLLFAINIDDGFDKGEFCGVSLYVVLTQRHTWYGFTSYLPRMSLLSISTKVARSLLGLLLVAILFSTCTENHLPHIEVTTDEAIGFDKKQTAQVAYRNEGNTVDLEGKIKARGGYSRKFAKHSYALELDAAFAVAGLPSDDDWVLNASYIDKTFMRHRFSFDLYREMSRRNIAPQCSYLTLATNGNE